MTGTWVWATPEFQAAKRQRDAEEQQRALGGNGIAVSRYGYSPRAKCRECGFALTKDGRVKLRANSVRQAAMRHVRETGHEVNVIIQDVTHYRPR